MRKVKLLLLIVLSVGVMGCKNVSKTETSVNVTSDSLPILPFGEEVQTDGDIQTLKPFKGIWAVAEKAEYDEQSGQSWGRYEVSLSIDFYDKSFENSLCVANDRHEDCGSILSFEIHGNEANIRYESLSTVIFSGKLIYNPKDKSMTIIDGELLDKQGVEDWMISDWQILRGEDVLEFKRRDKAAVNPNTLHLEGTLSKSKIKMQLNIEGEEASGTYCYTKHNSPITLIGKVIDGVYTLDEFNDGNNTGTFTLIRGGDGTWTGHWSNGDKNLRVNIKEL